MLLLFAVGMLQQWKNYILDLAHECGMFKRSTEPCYVSKIEDSEDSEDLVQSLHLGNLILAICMSPGL